MNTKIHNSEQEEEGREEASYLLCCKIQDKREEIILKGLENTRQRTLKLTGRCNRNNFISYSCPWLLL